jgi:hypothetical protein
VARTLTLESVARASPGASRLWQPSAERLNGRQTGPPWHVRAHAVRFGVQLAQGFEARGSGAGGDAGVGAAQEHESRSIPHGFEGAAGFEVAFRPEIFADFAALLHRGSVRQTEPRGPISGTARRRSISGRRGGPR